MKLRHKTLRIEFEVKPFRDKVHMGDEFYYETVRGSFIPHADTEWEAITPEVWVDVTDGCCYEDDGSILAPAEKKTHIGLPIIGRIATIERQHYRLRKVRLTLQGERWAFIIERKQP